MEEKKECIYNVRLQEAQQEERRRKGEEEEDEMAGAGGEKNVCSRRPDGVAIDSMKKTLYSLELTRTTHEKEREQMSKSEQGSVHNGNTKT